MNRFKNFVAELQHHVPFRIRYKDESPEMEVIGAFVSPFSPTFMENYTTVIGSTIYFPNREALMEQEDQAMRTLAHEAVHLLDSDRWFMPFFSLSYLFPQLFAIGIFAAPWLGWWALLFLLFLLPWPAPFRFHYEARAYAIDILLAPPSQKDAYMQRIVRQFTGWSYFRMYPFPKLVEKEIRKWMRKAERGEDRILAQVLFLYEMVQDEDA